MESTSLSLDAEGGSSRRPSYTTLSPSPSASSLTSSSSFDPHVSPTTESTSKPQVLGLSEIARMIKRDRDRRKGKNRDPIKRIQIIDPDPQTRKEDALEEWDERDEVDDGEDMPVSADIVRGPSTSQRDVQIGAGSNSEVFTADVSIRGWKIVGGKDWGDNARVGAYVVYDISITKRQGGTIEILRRYTDFVNLREALKYRFPQLSASIPKLPGKNHMSKFSEKLLADRKPRLQRFLRTVMLHPEMGRGGVGSVIGEWVLGGTTSSAKHKPG